MEKPFEFRDSHEGYIAKIAANYKSDKNLTTTERKEIQKIFGSGQVGKKNIGKLQRSFSRAKAIEKNPKDIRICSTTSPTNGRPKRILGVHN